MSLLSVIEVGHAGLKKSDFKKKRELKRLKWSLNYVGNATCERSKGKGIVHSL